MNADTYIKTIQLDDLTVEVHRCRDGIISDREFVELRTGVGKFWASAHIPKQMLEDKKSLEGWGLLQLKRSLKTAVWVQFATANNIKP